MDGWKVEEAAKRGGNQMGNEREGSDAREKRERTREAETKICMCFGSQNAPVPPEITPGVGPFCASRTIFDVSLCQNLPPLSQISVPKMAPLSMARATHEQISFSIFARKQ